MIPAIFAHLWQSTLFAAAACLVSLFLRANRAQARYWVWFAASAKFLVPFSLLVGFGALLPHPAAAPPVQTGWVAAFQELSQPIPLSAAAGLAAGVAGATRHPDLGAVAWALWACGFAVVAVSWLLDWKRVRALRRSARPVCIPTCLEIPVPVMSAAGLLEPGVFGILRPVLLLPEGIAGILGPAQLDALLAHELCHLRRRDNLMAAIHMAVQAVFWFHPLTWWIGARLLDEREHACDEEVLRRGCKPDVYAGSILAVCKLYFASPVACVSGVTGSDLKRRIESIMRGRHPRPLTLAKRLALAGVALSALLVPVVIGVLDLPSLQAQAAPDWQTKAGGKMAFEVASVKPSRGAFLAPAYPLNAGDSYVPNGGHFRADFPLWSYVQFAYKLWWPSEEQIREINRLPKWVATDRYTVEAKAAGNPTKDQVRLMVQSLVADRFHLAAHFESREVPVYALTLVKPGKPGPRLLPHDSSAPCEDPAAPPGAPPSKGAAQPFPPFCGSPALLRKSNGMLLLLGYRNATMETLANNLSVTDLGRPVIDRTGLSGNFDFTLEWAPASATPPAPNPPATPPDPLSPPVLEALRDQLGLRVESARASVPILVIDQVERPSDN